MTDGWPTLTFAPFATVERGCERRRKRVPQVSLVLRDLGGSEVFDAREPARLSKRASLSLTTAHVTTPKSRKTTDTKGTR
jgi:hypothetical protein